MKKKRIVPLLLSTAMLVSLLPSCSQPEDTPSPTPTGEAAVEDGYIPAPYTADASQSPTEYVAPVFYHELVCSATLRSAQILNISAH